jgi:hypothetical protein
MRLICDCGEVVSRSLGSKPILALAHALYSFICSRLSTDNMIPRRAFSRPGIDLVR